MRLMEPHIAALLRAAGAPGDIAARWAEPCLVAMRDGEINTPLRVAHFIAQIGHESDGFRTTREYASGSAYEGRSDLGNIYPGDGRRFRGRGAIQLTGRFNFNAFNIWLRKNGYDINVIDNPSIVEKMPWALIAAVYFWNREKLSTLADRGDDLSDVKRVTRRINGGYNGLNDRVARFVKVMAVIRAYDNFGELSDQIVFGGEASPVDDTALAPHAPSLPLPPIDFDDLPAPILVEPVPPTSPRTVSWFASLLASIGRAFSGR